MYLNQWLAMRIELLSALLSLAISLHKSKLIFLDEATASVDGAADLPLQLNTVASFDRILDFDRGAIVEFDNPAALLDKPAVTHR
ncbi:hypothetical protein DFJ73DRAFT_772321 [Zopfochytrium polystomum]|nr:hypothetical protein DFJ73DRAFT_772321 [Zopfochytrium polystomum]